MLSDKSKRTIAANTFNTTIKELSELSQKYIDNPNVKSWDDFWKLVRVDCEYTINKSKYIYETFTILHDDEYNTEMYNSLSTLPKTKLFQLYGQPHKRNSSGERTQYFYFEQFRWQTDEERERCNDLAIRILKELK